jgi:hypothetical protein
VGVISVPHTAVTVVTPPLPEEPPLGTLLRDKDGCVWERDDPTDKRLAHWFNGGNELITWEKLWARGPLARMVPDPADTAPDLPFSRNVADGAWLEVSLSAKPGYVSIAADRVEIEASLLGDFAAAILRAVREGRAT